MIPRSVAAACGGASATDTSLPPSRRTAADRWRRSPPAVSNTRSSSSTASSNGVAVSSITWSAPIWPTHSALAAEAVAITCAPWWWASWTARWPRRRGAVDEHPLAGLQPSVVEQPLPGAQPGEGEGGGRHVVQGSGLGCEERGRHRRVIRGHPVAIEPREGVHVVGGSRRVRGEPDDDADISWEGVAGSRSTGQSSSLRVIAAAWTRTSASPAVGLGVGSSSPTMCSTPPGGRSRTARIVLGTVGVAIRSRRGPRSIRRSPQRTGGGRKPTS